MESENNATLNQISKEILEMNNTAIQFILDENIDNALDILKESEKKFLKNQKDIKDPKIKIIINHNLACCYQKIKNIQKCIYHLEKVNVDFDSYLQEKHEIKIEQNYFLNKILAEDIRPNVLLGDFILELRFCAKFHLQMCAAYSQNNNHKEALNHAKLAALICEDNISKTYFLLKQIKKSIHNEQLYSKIFGEKVKENEPIIISLYKYIIDISKKFEASFKDENRQIFNIENISSFINNKQLKISTRNILGVIKNDDWLNLFNIGNIMFLCAMSYDDLDLDSDPKYELLRDAIIEKILMLTVSFFSISNEIRFINNISNAANSNINTVNTGNTNINKDVINTNTTNITNNNNQQVAQGNQVNNALLKNQNDNGVYFHSKAVEIACIYLPSTCPIIKHYVTSYFKYYGNANEINKIEPILNSNSILNKKTFDIENDPILNIGDNEIKIVDNIKINNYYNNISPNCNNNQNNNSMSNMKLNLNNINNHTHTNCVGNSSMSNSGILRNDSSQKGAKTERKREIKSALTGRSNKGSNIKYNNSKGSKGKNLNNNIQGNMKSGINNSKDLLSPRDKFKNLKNPELYNIKKPMKGNNNMNNMNSGNNGNNIKINYNFNKDIFSFRKMVK